MTMNDQDWELLQREVDGENDSDESSELRERLAREPDLVAHYQALDGVSRSLQKVRLVEPPAELVGDVMRGVRKRAFDHHSGAFGGLHARFTARPALALAATLAVGLAVGILATSFTGRFDFGRIDESAVGGTVLPPASRAGLPLIDQVDLGSSSLGATVTTRRGPDVVVTEIQIRSPHPLDLVVELDSEALRPRGFVSLENLPTGDVALEEDRVRVRQAPEGRYLLTLAVLGPDPAPLRIRLESGAIALEGQLNAAAPR